MKSEQRIKENLLDAIIKMGINEEINFDTKLFTNGILDSFNFVELIEMVENILNKPINQEDLTLANFDSINDIYTFLQRQNNN